MKRTLLAIAAGLAIACGNQKPAGQPAGQESETIPSRVSLTPRALEAAGVQVRTVAVRPTAQTLQFTGTVEANQQQVQQVTPLVSGRVDRVLVSLGTPVRRGTVLAWISSPEVAEMHGKLLEAQAKLNQAEATLRRTRKLSEIGAAAGKDLIAAEADAQTARLDMQHLRDALKALGDPPEQIEDQPHNIAAVVLRSPIAGVITERNVNPGSGVEANKPLFTVANLSTVWVIADVPEAQVPLLAVGAPSRVQSAALRENVLTGTVSYIDPVLNEATRTARVRVDVRNPEHRLKVGMFATVSIEGHANASLMIPEEAVQHLGDKEVVFVQNGSGFDVRAVTLGEKSGSDRQVLAGLRPGETIATKGSFTLKAKLLKGQFGEAD